MMGLAVLFDMDGVLVDSEPVINEAAILGLLEYGVKAVPEDFIPYVGAGEDRYIGGVAAQYGVEYKVEMKHRVYEIYLEIVADKIEVFDGVVELLQKIKGNGIRTALASSADRVKVMANLEAANISLLLFDVIVSGEDVENKKPAPDIYLLAAEKIGVKSEDCIVVEDALNGIMAAKAAGMRSIGVTSSFTKEELEKENPTWICKNISEVLEIMPIVISSTNKISKKN